MQKAVVSGLLAIAFTIFVIVPTAQQGQDNFYLARRLGRDRVAFDPLVEELEERAQEAPDHHSLFNFLDVFLHDDVSDKYGFVNRVKDLNITMRLMVLFPLIDLDPRDGFVSLEELDHWNLQQAMHRMDYRAHKELASVDEDQDGAVSFEEYRAKITFADGEAERWEERFKIADYDNNGALSFEEFRDFLHPEDSDSKAIQKWISREKLRRMDGDKDGKLSYVEFRDQAFHLYKTYAEFENSKVNVVGAKEKFAQLDGNQDGYLNEEEMQPILHYLHPGESAYASFYTNYLIHEADENEDGVLSLTEMIQNEYLFYNAVQDGIDDSRHDEI